MQTMVYPPAMQAIGTFDGGRITEQKPIGFPGEGSVIKRVGPLFYWAWATANDDAAIGLHPHKGFEIMTYVTQGEARHGDTLGTDSVVGAGGTQVMQTGSGVSHQERLGAGTEAFQIWFEPDLEKAFRRAPTYNQYGHGDFPQDSLPGVSVKTIIGEDAPIRLVAEARMWDIEVSPGAKYVHPVAAGDSLAALAIRGGGTWAGGAESAVTFEHKDFIVARAEADMDASIVNDGESALRMLLIQVPTTVEYPLYPKR